MDVKEIILNICSKLDLDYWKIKNQFEIKNEKIISIDLSNQNIASSKEKPLEIDVFDFCTSTKTLNLSQNPIKYLPIGIFDPLVNLEQLYLADIKVVAIDDNILLKNQNLKKLAISSINWEDTTWPPKYILSLPNLTTFYFNDTCIEDGALRIHKEFNFDTEQWITKKSDSILIQENINKVNIIQGKKDPDIAVRLMQTRESKLTEAYRDRLLDAKIKIRRSARSIMDTKRTIDDIARRKAKEVDSAKMRAEFYNTYSQVLENLISAFLTLLEILRQLKSFDFDIIENIESCLNQIDGKYVLVLNKIEPLFDELFWLRIKKPFQIKSEELDAFTLQYFENTTLLVDIANEFDKTREMVILWVQEEEANKPFEYGLFKAMSKDINNLQQSIKLKINLHFIGHYNNLYQANLKEIQPKILNLMKYDTLLGDNVSKLSNIPNKKIGDELKTILQLRNDLWNDIMKDNNFEELQALEKKLRYHLSTSIEFLKRHFSNHPQLEELILIQENNKRWITDHLKSIEIQMDTTDRNMFLMMKVAKLELHRKSLKY